MDDAAVDGELRAAARKHHRALVGVGKDVPALRACLQPVESIVTGNPFEVRKGPRGDRGCAVFGKIEHCRSDEHRRQDMGHDRQRVDAGIEDAEAAGGPDPSWFGCQRRTSSFQLMAAE